MENLSNHRKIRKRNTGGEWIVDYRLFVLKSDMDYIKNKVLHRIKEMYGLHDDQFIFIDSRTPNHTYYSFRSVFREHCNADVAITEMAKNKTVVEKVGHKLQQDCHFLIFHDARPDNYFLHSIKIFDNYYNNKIVLLVTSRFGGWDSKLYYVYDAYPEWSTFRLYQQISAMSSILDIEFLCYRSKFIVNKNEILKPTIKTTNVAANMWTP